MFGAVSATVSDLYIFAKAWWVTEIEKKRNMDTLGEDGLDGGPGSDNCLRRVLFRNKYGDPA